jgi:adenylate cyclase
VGVGQAGVVGDEAARPEAGQASLSGCGPAGPAEENRLELIRYAIASGATAEEIEAAGNIGELVLDLNLRPRLAFTLREVVDGAGIDWSRAQRLLAATGIPWSADEQVTAAEAATVQLLSAAASEFLGEAATVQLARVAGRAMAQIAETLVAAFRIQVELPRLAAGVPDVEVVKGYADIAQRMLPAFVGTLDALLRRQIVAVAERAWSTDDERSAVTLHRSIGFADLVGYTAAAATMSVRELMSTLVEFEDRTADVVLRGNGQIIKTIGDQAMFVTEDAGDACRIALDLVAEFEASRLPPIRVGLAVGQIVSVFGDLYGPDVNLAARLVGVAEPSTVVASESVRDACGDIFRFDPLPPLDLKGFAQPVSAYVVEP